MVLKFVAESKGAPTWPATQQIQLLRTACYSLSYNPKLLATCFNLKVASTSPWDAGVNAVQFNHS
jgi:hypothetical protein